MTVASGHNGLRIADLACGYGDVTATLLKRQPDACVDMVDYSDAMIERCRARFASERAIVLMKHDLNRGLPEGMLDKQYGMVVSCLALHHIDPDNRIGLYRDVHRVLAEKGRFVNADRFTEESRDIAGWTFDRWIRWMVQSLQDRMGATKTFEEVKQKQVELDAAQGDRPGTVWRMRSDLRQAGFESVDIVWKSYHLAILAAVK